MKRADWHASDQLYIDQGDLIYIRTGNLECIASFLYQPLFSLTWLGAEITNERKRFYELLFDGFTLDQVNTGVVV